MPKKTLESDSDSDSGPDDRNPPPAKKSKEDAKSSSSAKVSKPKSKDKDNDKDQTRWVLERMRFVNINEFRGRKMVDIREFYEKDGDTLPGKKGISLSILQWKKLLEIADEITAALED